MELPQSYPKFQAELPLPSLEEVGLGQDIVDAAEWCVPNCRAAYRVLLSAPSPDKHDSSWRMKTHYYAQGYDKLGGTYEGYINSGGVPDWHLL
jgi:hypothetical protein